MIDATADAAEGRRWFEEPLESGIEGVVVKGGAQPYRGGQRDW